jgi:leucyl aminopeptidase
VIPVCENAIDANAYKPHAILHSHFGHTVEVGNTDAEGRLALADAISYVQAKHQPNTMIDVATLTGACVVALGEYAAGLFSNNNALRLQLETAGNRTFERCWPMPIFAEHDAELKGMFADMRSIGKV